MRPRRVLLGVGIVLLAAVAALAAGLWWAASTGAAGRWAAAAVERATGHALRIGGAVRVAPGLVPTLTAEDVALLNPPGFSRPDLVVARRIEARVALLPLLRGEVEIRSLRVAGLDAKLEVNAAGRRNWERPPAPASAAPSAPGGGRRFAFSLREVAVDGGVLSWAGPGGPLRVAVPRLSAKGRDALRVVGEIVPGTVPLHIEGTVAPAESWPADLTLVGEGTALRVRGQGGAAPQASAQGMVSGGALDARLAPLGPVKLDAAWSPGGTRVHAEAGPFAPAPGWQVEQATLDAPALDQPVHLRTTLSRPVALTVEAQVGPPGAVLSGGPVPLLVTASGQGGAGRLDGTLAHPRGLRGLDAALSAQVADLAALAPGAPPLRDATLAAHLKDLDGIGNGVSVRGLSATAPQGDLAGDLAVTWKPRPALRGTLLSHRLDADALLAALKAPRQAPAQTSSGPAPSTVPLPAPRLIPDTALPTAGLRELDTDFAYTADALVLGGTEFHAVQTTLRLAGGALRLDPVSASSPGGPVQGSAGLDAAASPPSVTLALSAPSLHLGAFLPGASGDVGVNADLHGQGATWRAVAASLGGEADATAVDGQIDLGALGAVGEALRRSGVPVALSGQASLRCLAVRAAVADGVATLNPILLDAGRFGLGGEGQVDLRNETEDLHVHALVHFGPADAQVPLRVTGTLAGPEVAAESVGGRFGLMAAGKARDDCGPALAAARGGRPGPEPAAPPAAPRAERPADLLRSLLR